MDDLATFLHLLGALLLAAGVAVAGVGFEAARRREQPAEIAILLRVTLAGAALATAGLLLVLVFGLWLVHLEHYSFHTGWIESALGLYVVMLALGHLGARRPRQARLLATGLAAEGQPMTAELRALLDDRASRAANYLSLALVVAILALMVFKP